MEDNMFSVLSSRQTAACLCLELETKKHVVFPGRPGEDGSGLQRVQPLHCLIASVAFWLIESANDESAPSKNALA